MSVYTEERDGYTINILQDECASNPFTDWDCEPSLAVYSDRDITEYGKYGDVNRVLYLDRTDILKAMPTILEITGYASVWALVREVRTHSTDLDAGIHWELTEAVDNLSDSDRLEALCSIYNALGIPAVCRSIHGYSQGDYAEVLAVATPEFQEACGNASDYDWHSGLERSIQLFADWCYGNVYGYEVTDEDGEVVDSCWGFFGDYDAPFGALHEAEAAVNWDIAQKNATWKE